MLASPVQFVCLFSAPVRIFFRPSFAVARASAVQPVYSVLRLCKGLRPPLSKAALPCSSSLDVLRRQGAAKQKLARPAIGDRRSAGPKARTTWRYRPGLRVLDQVVTSGLPTPERHQAFRSWNYEAAGSSLLPRRPGVPAIAAGAFNAKFACEKPRASTGRGAGGPRRGRAAAGVGNAP